MTNPPPMHQARTHQQPVMQQQTQFGSGPPQQPAAPFIPAPVSTRRPMPALHLVGAGLLVLGLVFVGLGVRETFVAFGSALMGGGGNSGAGALLWTGGISILGGIVTGGVGPWLDSLALKQRFSL